MSGLLDILPEDLLRDVAEGQEKLLEAVSGQQSQAAPQVKVDVSPTPVKVNVAAPSVRVEAAHVHVPPAQVTVEEWTSMRIEFKRRADGRITSPLIITRTK